MSGLAERFRTLGRRATAWVRIGAGSLSDYSRLAAHHYRAAPPATVERVLIASHSRHGAIGVLVVSRPTLNARWRGAAWPGRYDTPDRRANAARLNAEVRTISRVIVDPRFRALGVARALVRAYLDAPLTVRTEAAAAMGACCPFFAGAGMTPVACRPPRRDERLARVLRRAGLAPHALFDHAALRRALERHAGLEGALRTWADASRATRRLARGGLRPIARAAATALCAPLSAFVHESPPEPSQAPLTVPPCAGPPVRDPCPTPSRSRRRPR